MESATHSSTEAVVEEGTTPPTLEPHTESSLDQEDDVSEDDVQKFEAALREGNIKYACITYIIADDEARRQCAAHLFSFGYDTLVQMINGIDDDKWRMLGIVLAHADQDLSNKIIDEMKPDDYLLSSSACGNVDLACNPDRFMAVLKMITYWYEQEWATRYGVEALFDRDRTECLDPMISALQSIASPDPELANHAIKWAFWDACEYTDHRSSIAKRFHDHPAIFAWVYSQALDRAYRHSRDPDHELFKWLVERADRDDLKEFNWYFGKLSPEDQKYVKTRHKSIRDNPITRHKRQSGPERLDEAPKENTYCIGFRRKFKRMCQLFLIT